MTAQRIAMWGASFAVLLNVALLGAYVVLTSSRLSAYPLDRQFPVIGGIGIDGSTRDGRSAPCYMVRITADDCQYCKLDYPTYTRFANLAKDAGCDIVAVAPVAGQMAVIPGDEQHQLKFVSMDLGEALDPFVTPQTIVLDAERKVRWHRVGMFDESSFQKGFQVLQRLQRR